jgi:hypothetical protein
MTKIKTFIFSTDGEYVEINASKTYDTRQQFEIAQEEIGLYDNGASHYLMEATDENLDVIALHHPQLIYEIEAMKHWSYEFVIN